MSSLLTWSTYIVVFGALGVLAWQGGRDFLAE